jgi:pentatricopeptide repeat protein
MDEVTYSTILDRLCKKGEIEKATNVLDWMISKGHQPNVVT